VPREKLALAGALVALPPTSGSIVSRGGGVLIASAVSR